MARVVVEAGICGFTTTIEARPTGSQGSQAVQVSYQSECPHVNKAKEELDSVDAFQELFRKPHDTKVYTTLSKHLPHVTCPLYSGFLKAIEVAAGMALPKDAVITIER